MEKTKLMEKLRVRKENVGAYCDIIRENNVQRLKKEIDLLGKYLNGNIFNKNWSKVENKSFYYCVGQNLYILDTERFPCSRDRMIREVEGISVGWPNYDDVKATPHIYDFSRCIK